MKRILYIGGFELPDKNAAAQRVIAIGKTFREIGSNVSFLGVSKDGCLGEMTFEGFSYKSLPYPKTIKQWFMHIWEFVSVKEIESFNPDGVILYNFPAVAGYKILRYCHKKGIKVFHDTTEWEYADGFSPRNIIKNIDTWLRMNYCLKKMDGVIAISRYLYDYYSTRVKTILIPPTVDLENKKWERGRVLTAGNNVKLVYAGSAGAKSKDRLDYIIKTMGQFDNMELKVVGLTKDQYEKDFGAMPKGSNNVVFAGRLTHTDAVKAVMDADFQILIRENTLKNRAGFPTKFVESISCCTPLIATLSSNIGDYLTDGKNGFVVNDNYNLYDVLDKVSSLSADDRVKMKCYCRNNNPFDYRKYIEEINKLF